MPRLIHACAALALALPAAGCYTPQDQNAANGAVLGGATGALIGAAATGKPGGALIGGAIGALTGATIGAAATPPPGYYGPGPGYYYGPGPGYYGPGPYYNGPPPPPPPGYGGPGPAYAGPPPALPPPAPVRRMAGRRPRPDAPGRPMITTAIRCARSKAAPLRAADRPAPRRSTSRRRGMNDARVPDSPLASEFIASPNHGERRGYHRPDAVILHYTGMPSGAQALEWLCDPASEVSSHYFIWEDGHIVQLVAEDRRAWHAGRGVWKGERDLNSASIGVEIVNPGHSLSEDDPPPFPAAQIDALIALLADVAARHRIPSERILAHSDIAPGRKRDPGERFPWETLWRAGLGHWAGPAAIAPGRTLARGAEGAPVRAVQAMLALYGYGLEISGVYDAPTRDVVAAFQRHFRPARVDGEADASTIETLRALLAGLEKA